MQNPFCISACKLFSKIRKKKTLGELQDFSLLLVFLPYLYWCRSCYKTVSYIIIIVCQILQLTIKISVNCSEKLIFCCSYYIENKHKFWKEKGQIKINRCKNPNRRLTNHSTSYPPIRQPLCWHTPQAVLPLRYYWHIDSPFVEPSKNTIGLIKGGKLYIVVTNVLWTEFY